MKYMFEESLIFLARQMLPGPMNVAFSRPHDNLYTQMYNPYWRNHLNFSWSQNNNEHSRSNHSNYFKHPNYNHNSSNHQHNFPNYHHNSSNHRSKFCNYQQNFSNQAPQSSFQGPPTDKKITDMERNIKNLIKLQTCFM